MNFGVCLPQYGRDVSVADLRAVAADAEAMGFHSVWVSDHVITPEHMHASIGPVFFDAFVVLSHVSAMTERVRLGTTVMVAPYRNPVVAAKIISSLDSLSGGRVILGVGAGGAPDEFAALGVPESQRGARTDEYLAAMIELWTTDPSSFRGRFVNFEGVRFAPKPVQTPHPPIWVGGRATLPYAGRCGSVRLGTRHICPWKRSGSECTHWRSTPRNRAEFNHPRPRCTLRWRSGTTPLLCPTGEWAGVRLSRWPRTWRSTVPWA